MMLGGKHREFMIYAGPCIDSWRYREIYIGLWQRASCGEGEIPWLFEWRFTTRWLPRVFVHGTIELCAFGRWWIWRK